ncbi:MAG: fructose-bisphosphate aldolase class I [Planctomycetota bacterium]|nr:fructose-bisphosphate aldolase class I [Planctomycetota bacterium]
MNREELNAVARFLVADGKGILAADESNGTANKRLKSVDVVETEENRREYRELLFRTKGLEQYISGVILYDETIWQKTADGEPLVKILQDKGIYPGIKVDTGAKDLALSPGEKVTEGLDGLRERLPEYRIMGARFAKWRAVITIGAGIPTDACINANAHSLARYAALCQEAGIVPIVEPETLMDGDHSLERCEAVTSRALKALFIALKDQKVALEGIVLKPNMVISGTGCAEQASVEDVANATLRCFRRHVPAAVPAIAFLSGGQSPKDATAHLSEMNKRGPLPWSLSFSYGRALQSDALQCWRGQKDKIEEAQETLLKRAQLCSAASLGEYSSYQG